MTDIIVLDSKDNVATCTRTISPGEVVSCQNQTVTAIDEIPVYHKISLSHIAKGEGVFKYGESIGTASIDIQPGNHVHIHNIESNRGRGDLNKHE